MKKIYLHKSLTISTIINSAISTLSIAVSYDKYSIKNIVSKEKEELEEKFKRLESSVKKHEEKLDWHFEIEGLKIKVFREYNVNRGLEE